jgi:hypothetical protein
MSLNCPKPSCTVAGTSRCFFNIEPADNCPVLRGELPPESEEIALGAPSPGSESPPNEAQDGDTGAPEVAPVLEAPPPAPAMGVVGDLAPPKPSTVTLSPGRELGLDGLSALARKRPLRLIGLLGAPAAGKTMALVSTFLLAAHGKLKGYEYRNSESAFAFDELSKGARAWTEDGAMLDQLVPHTELADERRPGFLHLRLYGEKIDTAVDLAFPDLPGEWTETLINKSVYDRLAFLRNADAIWIFVDGALLADLNSGYDVAARTCSLIGRLAAKLPAPVPLKLVVTRADQYDQIPQVLRDQIMEEAASKGFELGVHEIVSVDQAKHERSGDGISELLDASVSVRTVARAPERPRHASSRQMLRYRARQDA